MNVCAMCSTHFTPDKNHPKAKWCSRRCYVKHWTRAKRGTIVPAEKPCTACGKAFLPPIRQPNAASCSKRCGKRLNYLRNRELIKARTKLWAENNRERANTKYREYRKLEPEKAKARSKVGYAIATGKLLRPKNCEACGCLCKPQAHHYAGYDKPLTIKWLCIPCHNNEHDAFAHSKADFHTARMPPDLYKDRTSSSGVTGNLPTS